MATTRGILVERVLKAANGGTAATNMRVTRAQAAYELNAAIAKLLKAQVYEGFSEGQSTVDGAMIATYENVPFSRRGRGKTAFDLPATPMRIPGGIGVYRVYPSGQPEKEYIPVEAGLMFTVTRNKVLSPIGKGCYEYKSGKIWVNDDAVGAGVQTVDMELCVSDIMSLSDNEPLPIPADMEADAIIAVLQLFGVEVPTERADNKAASPTKADVK